MARVEVTGGRSAAIEHASGSGLGAVVFLLLFLGSVLLSRHKDWLDGPLVRGLNQLAGDWHVVSKLAVGLSYPSVEGIVVVSLVWGCWFSAADARARARLASGVVAAVLASGVAYVLLRVFPVMPKPIFDPALGLRPPEVLGNILAASGGPLANMRTFPSERATLFAGLAIATFTVCPRFGRVALAWTMLVEFSRVWLGLHYASDIIGSFCLAGTMICLGQMPWGVHASRPLINWERASPAIFYMFASFASYQLISGFEDLRDLASQMLQ